MSSFIPCSETGLGPDEQKRAAELEVDPQHIANLEAAEKLNRER
jgi:hypothetical protein